MGVKVYFADKLRCIDRTFSCCRGVASDAAEDSSLSKFHYLFVYNKEKSKYSLDVSVF